MRVATHIADTDHLAEALKSYVERRLHFALARFGVRVGQVTVRIGTNGPAENCCCISTEVLGSCGRSSLNRGGKVGAEGVIQTTTPAARR